MSKQTRTSTPATDSKPDPLGVFVVDESRDRHFWTKVGVAFPHSDGKGFKILITPGIAITGSLVVRERKPADAEE